MQNEEIMKIVVEESKANKSNNYQNGGPFGAAVVKNGEIVAVAHNTVIESIDATAHAEVNAIRLASKKLNTHDLSGCVLYTSAEPCPMCLSAIIWANIKEVYYANTKKDAANMNELIPLTVIRDKDTTTWTRYDLAEGTYYAYVIFT